MYAFCRIFWNILLYLKHSLKISHTCTAQLFICGHNVALFTLNRSVSEVYGHINGIERNIIIANLYKQILKREWPKNWQSFIPDIVGASKTNESMCQNNMVILKLLSEEVFDFSTGQMTQTKAKHLKDTMCSQFQQVFLLCIFVMVSVVWSCYS